jgi:acyl-CoA synthetase (NDP forming)
VASFRTPESCADAIAAVFSRRIPKRAAVTRPVKYHKTRLLDENESYELLDRIGIPRAATVIFDADRAQSPTLPFPYPVVAKVLSAEIAHKSDAGGVVLNIVNREQLLAAIAQIRKSVAAQRPPTKTHCVLVQPMISGIGEVLVGYRVDPDVGPLIMVAAGGVHAEIFRDRSLRLAPVDVAETRQMIAELRSIQLLRGHRGRPAGDLEALARTVAALSQLARRPEILEAEINPLIVQVDGVVAVDALVKVTDPA